MRNLPSAVAAHLAAGGHMDVQILVWITARNRITGEPESIGIWSGADHQVITVDGQARTYYGAGSLLEVDTTTSSASLKERSWSIKLSPLHPQVAEAVRTYEARLSPVEAHEWHINPETHLPLAAPVRVFRGTIMDLNLPVPPEGQMTEATINVVSDAWRLTRPLTLKRSQAALSARGNDAIRRHNSVVGVQTAWGERMAGDTGGGSINAIIMGLRPQ